MGPRTAVGKRRAGAVDARYTQRLDIEKSGAETQLAVVELGQCTAFAIHDELGAIAVDMESSVIAAHAAQAHKPFVCVRVVLDTLDMLLPPYVLQSIGNDGFPSYLRLAGALLRDPRGFATLPHLVEVFGKARRTLAHVSRATGPHLAGP